MISAYHYWIILTKKFPYEKVSYNDRIVLQQCCQCTGVEE